MKLQLTPSLTDSNKAVYITASVAYGYAETVNRNETPFIV